MREFVSPALQAMNLIRFIGDKVTQDGVPIGMLTAQEVGQQAKSPSDPFAAQLFLDLHSAGKIIYETRALGGSDTKFYGVNLSLVGWQVYEDEQRGEFAASYGFLAMEFNNYELECFVREILKPTILKAVGFELVDMRDSSEAGVIDNIMRMRIRDSRFVIVDLTHDNNGAYWEAGYAEGLGKPVIYICEQGKFDSESTHFDTNHCTTVPWSLDEPEEFKKRMIATLRQSLGLDSRNDESTEFFGQG